MPAAFRDREPKPTTALAIAAEARSTFSNSMRTATETVAVTTLVLERRMPRRAMEP